MGEGEIQAARTNMSRLMNLSETGEWGNGRKGEFEEGMCQRHIIFIEILQIFITFRPVRDGTIQGISPGYKYMNPDGFPRFFNISFRSKFFIKSAF